MRAATISRRRSLHFRTRSSALPHTVVDPARQLAARLRKYYSLVQREPGVPSAKRSNALRTISSPQLWSARLSPTDTLDSDQFPRRALAEAGIEVLPRPFLDFRDPWGNRVEIVAYDNIQFSKSHLRCGRARPPSTSRGCNWVQDRPVANLQQSGTKEQRPSSLIFAKLRRFA
jgi:hypothetical protein